MRKAMAEAEVGDDWYGDDPTVNRLEERCADLTGKDAAVYVATGTMANEIALHIFCRSGHLVVCEATSHVHGVEAASAASMSGIAFRAILAERGQFAAEADALMFCLSKGLGAPIGSVLCGGAEFVREARRAKVLFGAAWRQAGIMAAAGLIALVEGPDRLVEDHVNARRLADGIAL